MNYDSLHKYNVGIRRYMKVPNGIYCITTHFVFVPSKWLILCLAFYSRQYIHSGPSCAVEYALRICANKCN